MSNTPLTHRFLTVSLICLLVSRTVCGAELKGKEVLGADRKGSRLAERNEQKKKKTRELRAAALSAVATPVILIGANRKLQHWDEARTEPDFINPVSKPLNFIELLIAFKIVAENKPPKDITSSNIKSWFRLLKSPQEEFQKEFSGESANNELEKLLREVFPGGVSANWVRPGETESEGFQNVKRFFQLPKKDEPLPSLSSASYVNKKTLRPKRWWHVLKWKDQLGQSESKMLTAVIAKLSGYSDTERFVERTAKFLESKNVLQEKSQNGPTHMAELETFKLQ